MKALVLAAGLGTRLRPYTNVTPKPLFTIAGQPVLDRVIRQLIGAGATAVCVNTHHGHHRIASFLSAQRYPIPVIAVYEPVLLGTGGAVRNLAGFWDAAPFMVVNSDIVTDIDFAAVYRFHLGHPQPATLVLTRDPAFDTVALSAAGNILGFDPHVPARHDGNAPPLYTFTGIQVLDGHLPAMIPENTFYHSIDLYRELIARNTPPKAFLAPDADWRDIGTPHRYQRAVRDAAGPAAFEKAFGSRPRKPVTWEPLAGDGSDRRWFRLRGDARTLVAVDHGLSTTGDNAEAAAFCRIGCHLKRRGVAVPEIFHQDLFSGVVVMTDLGDRHLQTAVREAPDKAAVDKIYRRVIDLLIAFSREGIREFDPQWTCQTPAYDRALILERECGYFLTAFLRGHMGLDVPLDRLAPAFAHLAENALHGAVTGLLHRDFQSRNILLHRHRPHAIDFQGARVGPIQYDLASLLIDPYVDLSEDLADTLLNYAAQRLAAETAFDPVAFRHCYRYCRVTRNLQILGAFAYLSGQKGKQCFAAFIPSALFRLKKNLAAIDVDAVCELTTVIAPLCSRMHVTDGIPDNLITE